MAQCSRALAEARSSMFFSCKRVVKAWLTRQAALEWSVLYRHRAPWHMAHSPGMPCLPDAATCSAHIAKSSAEGPAFPIGSHMQCFAACCAPLNGAQPEGLATSGGSRCCLRWLCLPLKAPSSGIDSQLRHGLSEDTHAALSAFLCRRLAGFGGSQASELAPSRVRT